MVFDYIRRLVISECNSCGNSELPEIYVPTGILVNPQRAYCKPFCVYQAVEDGDFGAVGHNEVTPQLEDLVRKI